MGVPKEQQPALTLLGVKAQLTQTPPNKNSIYLGKSNENDKELKKIKSTARIFIPAMKQEETISEKNALGGLRLSGSQLKIPAQIVSQLSNYEKDEPRLPQSQQQKKRDH